MSKNKNERVARRTNESDELSLLDKISRLLGILVRLNLQTMRGDHNQRDMILMLDSAGCGPSEIADLLGTTSNTVNVSLSIAKKKKRKK